MIRRLAMVPGTVTEHTSEVAVRPAAAGRRALRRGTLNEGGDGAVAEHRPAM